MMTPHEIDVAFVLESVAGVRTVLALSGVAHFDFAVELEPGGRTLAEAHYALLRVMSHADCARVYFFRSTAPHVVTMHARPLSLTLSQRDEARARVPPPPPREAIIVCERPVSETPSVLFIGGDAMLERRIRDALDGTPLRIVGRACIPDAVELAEEEEVDLFLCDARLAFGRDGLFAKLPLGHAERVLVLVDQTELADARRRLSGTERILTKNVEGWVLRERVTRILAVYPPTPDIALAARSERPNCRRLVAPLPTAPLAVLCVGIDDPGLHAALRRAFPEDARHVIATGPIEQAVEQALSSPFHLVVCSGDAALHPRSFLDAIALEDEVGADGVLVVAPPNDLRYVKHKLARMGRKNTILALPIDEASMERELYRRQPSLGARVAIREHTKGARAETIPLAKPKFRRLATLVIDDDMSTQILFARGALPIAADVTLATTLMDAFDHVISRPVDVLLVSATMRGEGGEPIYRTLWRVAPELKSRSVLIIPPKVGHSSKRAVEWPLSRDSIARAVEDFQAR